MAIGLNTADAGSYLQDFYGRAPSYREPLGGVDGLAAQRIGRNDAACGGQVKADLLGQAERKTAPSWLGQRCCVDEPSVGHPHSSGKLGANRGVATADARSKP